MFLHHLIVNILSDLSTCDLFLFTKAVEKHGFKFKKVNTA